MKSIIVPIDFSAESLNGLKMALLFSSKTACHIEMLHVLQKSQETEKEAYITEKRTAEEKLNKILSEFVTQKGKDSTLSFLMGSGRIYQEVVNLASKNPDTLITTSTHGASGFQEYFIGSNTFRIISATDKPVIAIRKNRCPEDITKIVLPIDLSADSRQKVPITTDIAKLFGAEIHVVGIHTSKNSQDMKKIRSYTGQVAGFVEGKVHCESNEVFGDSIPEMLLNYANTVKADLISITTEQSPGFSLIIGNTAHMILNKTEIPILCLTPKHITKSGSFASMGG